MATNDMDGPSLPVTDFLILRLMERQHELGLNDTQMAERLRTNRATWSLMRRGLKPPSLTLVIGALVAFPGLVMQYGHHLRKRHARAA